MTRLLKPVTRETVQLHRGRPMVVSLQPAGYVEIRPKGKRAEVYRLAFEAIMFEAGRRAAEHQRVERARERRSHTR